MGEVYRARDTRLNRDVALKILPESFSRDADRLRRFEQESQAVAALNHPNILAIYDVGHYEGSPFLVSELLEGESLRAVLDRGLLPPRKVIDYAVQIAKGLSAAHDKGIVHRDLKPDNLFICRDGRVKILDFGLAKLATKQDAEPDGPTMTSHTAAGVVMGTVSYMAPEQVRGEFVDARTDMFSFGGVLFEMVSGHRAFHRDTAAETMTATLKDDAPEITDLPTPVAPALERIIRRCLEKSPDQRFQSAKDLAFALEALSQLSREVLENVQDADWAADGQNLAVVRLVPETSHWRLEYPVGKVLFDSINWISNPKISPDGRLVAIADHENPDGDDEGSVAIIDLQGHEKKLSGGWTSLEGILWSPTGDEIWFSASNSGSSENLRAATLNGKVRTIANVPGGMWFQDLRNGVALMVTHQQRLNIRALQPGGKEERELGWLGWSYLRDISRAGTKILFEEEAEGGGPNYTSFLRDTDGSPPVPMSEGEARAISPDNKWVVTKPLKSNSLTLVPTGAGQARQFTDESISYSRVRFFPDGKHLLAAGIEPGHGGRDYLIDVNDGKYRALTPEGVVGTALSQDGTKIAVRDSGGQLGVWPMDGSGLRTIPGVDPNYRVIGWSPDASSLYLFSSRASERTGKIYQLNPSTGKIVFWKEFGANLLAGGTSVGAPHFSADGKAYAYVYVQDLSQAYTITGLK